MGCSMSPTKKPKIVPIFFNLPFAKFVGVFVYYPNFFGPIFALKLLNVTKKHN
jgi:hypothetical protein